ncbi:unnamed protein product [Caenorhabditis auriculariae]|uniref:BHLH domain-containing protein n=1 Tax=Caenorhabditis auriculariae TaxID=2777116 RepID=A0A8S1GXL5_9PELO|nr:unnamed protein product [Caenorhabditis auriculariae]
MMADDRYEQVDDEDLETQADGGWRFQSPFPKNICSPTMQNRPMSQAASLSPTSGGGYTEQDRRIRRQIANCNERRRMQSINAGFQSLRALLPRKFQEGEKLSKAAILQQTADLIHDLKNELKLDGAGGKKPKMEYESDDRATISQLQRALEQERSARLILEQEVSQLRALCQAQHEKMHTTPSSSTGVPTSLGHQSLPPPTRQEHSDAALLLASSTSSASLAAMSLDGGTNGTATPLALCSPMVEPNLPPPASVQSIATRLANQGSEASVIRPTPLTPISVDVSSPSLSTPSPLAFPFVAAGLAPQHHNIFMPVAPTNAVIPPPIVTYSQPSAFSSTANANAHRSLQTILDAIRHLENGGGLLTPSPPPTSQAPLVR